MMTWVVAGERAGLAMMMIADTVGGGGGGCHSGGLVSSLNCVCH